MLDTGIDIPEVVNLVFFKLVRSKTKFWQMVGRGTRLCPDLFGPGQDKEFFYLFDYCQNLEFFSQDIPATEGCARRVARQAAVRRAARADRRAGPALDAGALAVVVERGVGDVRRSEDRRRGRGSQSPSCLQREVAAMNLDNFVVRPHRRARREVRQAEAWPTARRETRRELSHEVAGLPSELDPENEEAKRFDLLMLSLQLALLRAEPGFARLRDQVQEIAGLLEEKAAIPMVREQMALIQDVQTDEWWQDVTVPMLEAMRRRLRDLVQLIDKRQRKPIYTDFEDLMGGETDVTLPGFAVGTD